MEAATIVARFNDCINRRDLAGLTALMTEDHAFVDTAGARVAGRDACVEAWRGFFEAFPDYRNVFDALTEREGRVVVTGRSECSEPALTGPAIWTADVRDGAVTEWRVYDDSPDTRRRLIGR